MEFMNVVYGEAYLQWLFQFLVVLFLVGGLALLAVGVGLIVHSAGTLRFFTAMNRWVSLRRVFRHVDIPRDTRLAVQKYRRFLVAIFVAGGVLAIFGLATQFDASAFSRVLGLDFLQPAVASWLVESARWMLIVGNLAAIVIGTMLGFFPDALIALEARGSHWFSERQLTKGADTMNFTLDKWVEAFPRASGWIITFFALVLVGAFALMLPAIQ